MPSEKVILVKEDSPALGSSCETSGSAAKSSACNSSSAIPQGRAVVVPPDEAAPEKAEARRSSAEFGEMKRMRRVETKTWKKASDPTGCYKFVVNPEKSPGLAHWDTLEI